MCIFQMLDILINNIFVVNIGRVFQQSVCISMDTYQGRIQDFKFKGAYLKKIAPSRGKRENVWGISSEKSRFYAKKSYFFKF